MAHPLVEQLQFSRTEFMRCFSGMDPTKAEIRLTPSNALSWIVGHLANQEQSFWLYYPKGELIFPDLHDQVGTGKPPSIPDIDQMWKCWKAITAKADAYLKSLTVEDFTTNYIVHGKKLRENIGTLLYRNIYHYWFHIGEAQALRQQLGDTDLPQFVGDMTSVTFQSWC